MDIRIGPPVSGSNYFPRPGLQERVLRDVGRGHVSLLAPRRTGKTSLLTFLRDSCPGTELRPLINVERCAGPAEWIAAMLGPLAEPPSGWGKARDKLGKLFTKLDGVEITGLGKLRLRDGDWEGPAERVLDTLLALDRPVTFLLDEFPTLVAAMARSDLESCRSALHWFREWRQRTADSSVRFLVTGSIGLEPVVKRFDLWDTVNDFTGVSLPPLSEAEAHALLSGLLEGIERPLAPELVEYAVATLTPPWPFFVQLLAGGLEEPLGAGQTADEALIDRVYLHELVTGPRNQYTSHMYERLRRIFDDVEQRVARAILKRVAFSEAGLTREQLGVLATEVDQSMGDDELGFVLDVLKHDGYLFQDLGGQQRTRFFSQVLRDYWIRRLS